MYVIKSPTTPPMPAESQIEVPAFLNAKNVPYPVSVPTIPMENSFAPSAVIPPCPMNVWKNSAIADTTMVAPGPMIIAAIGVPTGCEHDPVTGTGMCHTDMTKTAAPMRPTRDMYDGLSLRLAANCLVPTYTKAPAIRNQIRHQYHVSIPSAMCNSLSLSRWMIHPA